MMRTIVKSRIRLKANDYKLFEYLYFNQVASFGQISKYLFPEMFISNLSRRLNNLEKNDYLKKRPHYDQDWNGKVFSITSKSLKECLSYLGSEDTIEQILSGNISHDLYLGEIRESLKRFKNVSSYYTENMLRSTSIVDKGFPIVDLRSIRSDAAFKLKYKNAQHFVALEYEPTFKDKQRYRDKFLDYCTRDKIAAVFYVMRNTKQLTKMIDIESKELEKYTAKFYYSCLDDVLNKNQSVTFKNRKGKTITLQ